ncbi:YraN family protein [Marinobacteraceae bacterium S3BR75-40.1]
MDRRSKGATEERLAERYLRRQGLKTIARNFTCRGGEIDLVCLHRDEIVFVEVRFRGPRSLVSSEESITPTKRRRIIKAARYYLAQHSLYDKACRFDVLAINQRSSFRRDINWITHAFEADS